MLFDLKPKEDIKDFFGYREELRILINHLKDKNTRIILVRGLRRTGKSSLTRVALREAKVKSIIIDARELVSLSRKSFENKILEKLKKSKSLPEKLLEKISGVDVGIRLNIKNEQNLWDILKAWPITIVADEVQMLKGTGVEAFFAALYDNTDCKVIMTGSEIGLIDDFVGKNNPKAPLFGRAYSEIKMHSLEREQSKEFLRKGFVQLNKSVNEETLEKVVNELDGIIGWLTLFGNNTNQTKEEIALKETVNQGKQLVYSEFETFLGSRISAKLRYTALIKIISLDETSWSNLKTRLQLELNQEISDPQFTNYLDSLMSYGFIVNIEGKYSISDPLLKRACSEK